MTNDQLDERIQILKGESDTLVASHNATCQRFDQIVAQNRTRYAQIQGAIQELNSLKAIINSNGSSVEPEPATNRIL